MTKEYKTIRKRIYGESIENDELEGDIGALVDYLIQVLDKHRKAGWDSVELEPEYGYEGSSLALYGLRKESNIERDKRLAKAKKARESRKRLKIKKEEKERKEYERLKKKFGD